MELEGPTIAEVAARCLNYFNNYFGQTASIQPRQYSLVEDQFARFSIWTSNIGAFAPGQASVDHRLKEVPEIHDVVTGLLEALNDGIEQCENSFC